MLHSICLCREEQKGLAPDLLFTITADAFAKQSTSIGGRNVHQQLKDIMNARYDDSVTIQRRMVSATALKTRRCAFALLCQKFLWHRGCALAVLAALALFTVRQSV
jgi:hypothetical protein